ncbi:MAG: DUF2330 domain-containing protein [Pseudanabaenaceae cyanobacterium bins.68]|nr:DUF2330 domain-containing protein [Pseudanabaenaceae cyanobacterium bins.68]
MRSIFSLLLAFSFACFSFAPPVLAFCGFYVAKADAKLYNQASQVAIARDGNRTILTMANDYQGQPQDFALVVPVPTVLKQEQVRIGDPQIMQRLDAFSAPRLVEYFDADPCAPRMELYSLQQRSNAPAARAQLDKAEALGIKVEEQFSVGEYDIVILSAKESNGLKTWLTENGYRLPRGASALLQPYIRQGLKFFVAKVNLKEFAQASIQKLRPLMIAYESPRFMLPIRLGMTNAKGSQDLLVYLLSPKGQVELVNYRTAKIPSDQELPIYVKDNFGEFYRAMFQNSHRKAGKSLAFLEYAWDMANCDPCAAEPLSREELRQAGVFWLDEQVESLPNRRRFLPNSNVFITRLHIRYDRATFPEDLQFKETNNRQLFQGRYILRHPYRGKSTCAADVVYRKQVRDRQEREAETLAQLTGWNLQDLRRKSNITENRANNQPFWRRFWR